MWIGRSAVRIAAPTFEFLTSNFFDFSSFQNFADTQEAFTTYSEEEDTNPGLSIRMVYPSKNMGVLVVVMLEK